MDKKAPKMMLFPDPVDESYEFVRSLTPSRELYVHKWSTGFQHEVIKPNEAEKRAKEKGVKTLKKKHDPGKERYTRLPHEQIRIP